MKPRFNAANFLWKAGVKAVRAVTLPLPIAYLPLLYKLKLNRFGNVLLQVISRHFPLRLANINKIKATLLHFRRVRINEASKAPYHDLMSHHVIIIITITITIITATML